MLECKPPTHGVALTYSQSTHPTRNSARGVLRPLYGARFRRENHSRMPLRFAPLLRLKRRATNGIPLGCSLILPVHTGNCVQTLKAFTARTHASDRSRGRVSTNRGWWTNASAREAAQGRSSCRRQCAVREQAWAQRDEFHTDAFLSTT
jgi:hypothetical protein